MNLHCERWLLLEKKFLTCFIGGEADVSVLAPARCSVYENNGR